MNQRNRNKKKIWLTVIAVIMVAGFFIYKSLFPSQILDNLPNTVRDRATLSRAASEAGAPNSPLKEAYFGDLHVHTNYSFDAYIGGTLATPDDAYRFAQGETLDLFGQQVQLKRPLDFAAVTDHAEFIGELYSIQNEGTAGHNALMARFFREVPSDTTKARKLFERIRSGRRGASPAHLPFFQGYETTKKAWDVHLEAAEKHYNPGVFTTFAGYEWSFVVGEAHLHRNVIFRDMKVPEYPISALEAKSPEALWRSLAQFTEEGATVLAIPHNSNLSKGLIFPEVKEDGQPIDKIYAETRNKFEPLIEVHQAKGNSEVHAQIWGNDEFANFENYSYLPVQENNYVRYGLKKGLEWEAKLGANPFKYGMIGSTDTHNAIPGNTEENGEFVGNHTRIDKGAKERRYTQWVLAGSSAESERRAHEAVNPGGLVGVWARSNTRGEIWDGLKRKETYATSGGRIKVRLFGGEQFKKSYASYQEMVADGYEKGVPMGGDLSKETKKPSFIIWAQKDAESANLDRIEVIKGWYENGKLHEKIFTVALSDGRKIAADGTVPSNDATVNMETGEYDKTKGAVELQTVWTDETFNPAVRCFYYLRVLEIPTARYTLLDQIRYGVKYPEGTALTVRERAWSSPIWYSPK